MEFVHRCIVCGWERPAESATVTSPRCENCGCALEAASVAGIVAAPGLAEGVELPEWLSGGIVRIAAIVGAAVLMLAAARVGYQEGGPAIAVSAIGVAGLMVVMAMSADSA